MPNPQRSMLATQIQPNKYFIVKGTLDFNRVDRRFTAAEIEQRNANSPSNFPDDPNKPFATATVIDAEVLRRVDADGNELPETTEDQYAAACIYQSKQGRNAGRSMYSAKSKGRYLPWVMARDEGVAQRAVSTLASGVPAYLVMRTFGGNRPGQRVGVSLDGIILDSPTIEYGTAANRALTDALAEYGITMRHAANPNDLLADPSQDPALDYDGATDIDPNAAATAAAVASTVAPTQTASGYAQPQVPTPPVPPVPDTDGIVY